MKILQINASARRVQADGQGSFSTRLATELVAALKQQTPAAAVTVRDLGMNPHPAMDEAALGALFTPAEARSAEQNARVAQNDALIDELQAQDVIVIGVPMINFGIPTQLKHWIDAVARAGTTFRYTAQGPEGLVKGKKVFLVMTRGGVYRDQPSDTMVPYLKTVLSFLGMSDLSFIYAEGLAMGPDAESNALASARAQIAALFETATA